MAAAVDDGLATAWDTVLHACCRHAPAECQHLYRRRYRSISYSFYVLRCGIFVRVHGGRVHTFCRFVNPGYHNAWASRLRFVASAAAGTDKGTALSFREFARVRHDVRRSQTLADARTWWAGPGILCNEGRRDAWGTAHVALLRRMCERIAASGVAAEFMLNKRDWPTLRGDRRHPHAFLWPAGAAPRLPAQWAGRHLPVLSFYGHAAYDDVCIPPPPDLAAAIGEGDDGGDDSEGERKAVSTPPWRERKAVAVFRGGATGRGVTTASNQRLHLASLTARIPYLDAGITSWNMRDKVVAADAEGATVTCVLPRALPFGLSPWMDARAQRGHKFVLYVDGHCAASRIGTLARSGSVLLRVLPSAVTETASRLYAFGFLTGCRLPVSHTAACTGCEACEAVRSGEADHFEVDADLSNLAGTLRFCVVQDAAVSRMPALCRRRHDAGGAAFLARICKQLAAC